MYKTSFQLSNGVCIPCIGYGTCEVDCEKTIQEALRTGYRLIDTASHYFNEAIVGDAINNVPIRREEIFVTTKLWYSDMGGGGCCY